MPNNDEIDDIIKEIRKKKSQYENLENNTFEIEEEKTPQSEEQFIETTDYPEPEETKKPEDVEEPEEVNEPEEIVEPENSTVSEETPQPQADDENPQNFEITSIPAEKGEGDVDVNEAFESEKNSNNENGKKKKIAIIVVIAVVIIALVAGIVAFAVTRNKNDEEETTTTSTTAVTTTQPVVQITNPLTGENSYNESAVGKRPVAIVVENASAARPQWGIDDSTNAPDIILEGEVEGGETRMLWLYADYTSVPSQVGPIRSARPPFIKFSELFDSIFIHWGQSSTTSDYTGADTVFQTDDVDHINQMTYSDKFGLFGRDSSRGVSSEHTGVLYGNVLADAIDASGFRTDVDSSSFTQFSFNEKATTVSDSKCLTLALTFSSSSKTRDWTYSTEDNMYHSTDYLTDVTRTNLLVLYDQTEYITKSNYKGSGSSEIYCNYKLAGGSGVLASMGTVTNITWSVDDGKLTIKDESGNTVKLNPGKTWIGYASANHGGNDVETSSTTE